jgi:hypothetical protein
MLPDFHLPPMQQVSKPPLARLTIATLLFVLGCLLSTVRVVRDAPRPGYPSTDDVAKRSDQRFAALKAALPPRGVVGYVGDSSDPVADYYLAQYALAPLVIDHSPNHALVIGNFPASLHASVEHLQLVTDFGNGVLLFANQDAK